MIGVLIILSLTSAALSEKYYLSNGIPQYFPKIPFGQTNIFFTDGKEDQNFVFTLTMKKMNETPFDYLYYDTWVNYDDNGTIYSSVDVQKIITITDIITINYTNTIYSSDTNYIGFKFTPAVDLENVYITIDIYGEGKGESGSGSAVILYFLLLFIFAPCICCIIVIVVIVVVVVQCSKKSPPPQLQNNNPYQQQNLPQKPQYYPPQQPQYYPPPQPQYYPPSQPQILVQPQNPQINNSISDNSLDKIGNK